MTSTDTTFDLSAATEHDIRMLSKWFAGEGWDFGIRDFSASLRYDDHSILILRYHSAPIGCIRSYALGDRLEWISNFLLSPSVRDKGLGRVLWKSVMQRMEGKVVGLDSPLEWVSSFEKLGFKTAYHVLRYKLVSACDYASSETIVPFDEALIPAVAQLDKKYIDADRIGLIAELLKEPLTLGRVVVEAGEVQGYGLIRPTQWGWKIGPLVAPSIELAVGLVNALATNLPVSSTVYIDVPEWNEEMVALMNSRCKSPVTSVARMYNGPAPEIEHKGQFSTASFDLGYDRYCPICKEHSSRFSSFGVEKRDDVWCPHCSSLERHRLLWLLLERHPELLFNKLPDKMLHVAPEPLIKDKFKKLLGSRYITADICKGAADVQMDICDIKLPDNSFDAIMCSHVLEHVTDDSKAMSELRRVLTPEGIAFIMVPITVEKTFEDPSITDPEERLRVFGQIDHVRRYGMDFVDRLKSAGFKVECFTPADVASKSEIVKMRLKDQFSEAVYVCRK